LISPGKNSIHIPLFTYILYIFGANQVNQITTFVSVIILLIIIGIIVAGSFLAGFIWAVKSGQYDDTYSPAVRMLFDDAKPVKKKVMTETRKRKLPTSQKVMMVKNH